MLESVGLWGPCNKYELCDTEGSQAEAMRTNFNRVVAAKFAAMGHAVYKTVLETRGPAAVIKA